jgi:hypothetical protein
MSYPVPYSVPVSSILDAEVANHVRIGWAVESRSETMAVMVSSRRTNHVLHLLLTLITCGFWAFVWIIVALSSGTSRVAIVVYPNGAVTRTRY